VPSLAADDFDLQATTPVNTVRITRSGTSWRQPPLVLELSHNVDQHTERLVELLFLCPELLHILHQREQLPRKGVNLFEHDIGSGSLQRRQECLGFSSQAVSVVLVTRHLFVQTLPRSQTLLDDGLVVSPRLEGNFCRDGAFHTLRLRINYTIP
jgi:hypothetical protein